MVRFDAVGPASFHKRIEVSAGVSVGHGIGKHPTFSSYDKFASILPISGKKLKSITVGIRCMVAASKFETSSSAAAVWCILKLTLA